MPAEDKPIIITCSCGQRMKVPAGGKGKAFKCVKCGARIRLAEDAPPPPSRPVANGKAEAPEPPPAAEPIGQLLLNAHLITQVQLDEALAIQKTSGGKTFEILISLGYLDRKALHDFLSRQPGVAAIELDRFEIDPSLVELIPRKLALECLVLPIDKLGKLLTVAMACPLDVATIGEMEQITGLKVKAMLCKLDDIHAAVRKYYRSEEIVQPSAASFGLAPATPKVSEAEIGEQISRLERLVAPGQVVALVEEMGRDAGSTVRDLAAVAGTDLVLAAALLRSANSPAYGMPARVDSVPLAVALLGKAGVMAVVAETQAGLGRTDFDAEPISRRAHRCASVAAALAVACGRVPESPAYTAGLFHQLGCLALASVSPAAYRDIDSNLLGIDLAKVEDKTFALTHPEAGQRLASRWRFPARLCAAIGHYLKPEQAGDARDLASVVSVAAAIAGAGGNIDVSLLAPCKAVLAHLGLDAAAAVRVAREAVKA